MSEELDVFAGAVPPKGGARQNGQAKPRQYRTFKKFNRTPGQAKPNGSPIRGANGEESVNPLLNAPLPTDQKELEPEAPANPNRNPDLPEHRLADIQTWPAPAIVERMMPGADPEELGSYRKHELIFAAIRSYLARGGAVQKREGGAAALFYPGTQAMIAHVLDEDYLAIPSSLHEFIIIRASRIQDMAHLQKMVYEANRRIVSPEDVLSDNVLRYSKGTGKLITVLS